MLERFDYKTYQQLLKTCRRHHANVYFADFPLQEKTKPYFILRHDVDFSPVAALKMAKLEARQGIRATYFFLFSSPCYNLLSKEYQSIPSKLIALGHEVGLHYDLEAYEDSTLDTDSSLKMELEMLSTLCRHKVRTLAMHNPSLHHSDPFRSLKGYHNAYAKEFTEKIAYFSDSCGEWRPETRAIFSRDQLPPRFQLLIHPIFWDTKARPREEQLDRLGSSDQKKIKIYVELVKKGWAKHTKSIAK